MGTNMTDILRIGLGRDVENHNVCPNINFNTDSGIKLDLDPECSWDFKNKTISDIETEEIFVGNDFFK
tara:strand:+ start:731 stop:934 length:204 start_codon:yes stop_codon:yes gene_type:complete